MDELQFWYQRFAGAIARGEADGIGQLVDMRRFRALLPGGSREGMDFASFLARLERLRAIFSDFGQNVDVRRVLMHENQIAVYYVMNLTYDGALSSQGDASAPSSGQEVLLTAVDIVTFDVEGMVMELITVSDRFNTLVQMGVM